MSIVFEELSLGDSGAGLEKMPLGLGFVPLVPRQFCPGVPRIMGQRNNLAILCVR